MPAPAFAPSVLVGSATLLFAHGCPAVGSSPPAQFRAVGDPIPTGPMTGTPVLADFDNDGDLDAAVPCGPCCGRDPDPNSGHLQLLLNDGTGRLDTAGERIKLGETSLGADVGDINHDGVLDLVVYEHSSYNVSILLGKGDGQFETPRRTTLHSGGSPHVHSIVLSDVNNDSHLDITATLVDDHALAVLLGDGTGAFTPALGQPYFAHRHPYSQLNMVDINRDGAMDAIMTDMRGGGLTVLVGSGTGMFASSNGFHLNAHTPITTAERPMACALGDIDGDGDLDAIAVFDESPQAARLMNEGGGRFVEPKSALITLAGPSTGVKLADVTGDGVLDVVTSTTTVKYVSISPGNGDGTFSEAFRAPSAERSPQVAIGDMNGDGANDLVVGYFDAGSVAVLLRTTSDADARSH